MQTWPLLLLATLLSKKGMQHLENMMLQLQEVASVGLSLCLIMLVPDSCIARIQPEAQITPPLDQFGNLAKLPLSNLDMYARMERSSSRASDLQPDFSVRKCNLLFNLEISNVCTCYDEWK